MHTIKISNVQELDHFLSNKKPIIRFFRLNDEIKKEDLKFPTIFVYEHYECFGIEGHEENINLLKIVSINQEDVIRLLN